MGNIPPSLIAVSELCQRYCSYKLSEFEAVKRKERSGEFHREIGVISLFKYDASENPMGVVDLCGHFMGIAVEPSVAFRRDAQVSRFFNMGVRYFGLELGLIQILRF